jgi:hypothetical protein
MKHSADFYKVVNAVINTIQAPMNVGVPYVKSNGEKGEFTFDSDNDQVREELMQYNTADDDRDLAVGSFGTDNYSCDIWTLFKGNDFIQLAIYPDNYITSSYELRDLISDCEGLECAEITEGRNGYPSSLRGCVLLDDCGKTFEEMQQFAERYGVELVSLHRRAGWDLWECKGTAYELYDFQDFVSSHDDNIVTFCSFKSYADYLREVAAEVADDEEPTSELVELADKVENEVLGVNEFISVNTYDLTRYEKEKMLCDHFEYDSHYYTLALDCMVTE